MMEELGLERQDSVQGFDALKFSGACAGLVRAERAGLN